MFRKVLFKSEQRNFKLRETGGGKKVVKTSKLDALIFLVGLAVLCSVYLQYQALYEGSQEVVSDKPERLPITSATAPPPPLYVTVLLPSEVNQKNAAQRLKAIEKTWGPAARVIFVTAPGLSLPHLSLASKSSPVYPQAMPLPPTFDENNVPRLKYIIEQIHQKVDPDFAFFANDHTFIIPEHLCHYLNDKKSTQDLYAGHALQTKDYVFNSGAAGYFLSRSTMTKLVLASWAPGSTNPACTFEPDKSTKAMRFLQKSPGLFLTNCLRQGLNIKAIDTREDSAHRFHAFPITKVVSGKMDGWYRQKHTLKTAQHLGTDPSYATLLDGPDCCAVSTASFHYVEDMETRALFAVRHELVANSTLTDAQLKQVMIPQWPTKVGGYNQGLPSKEQAWKPLLQTIRKISSQVLQQTC